MIPRIFFALLLFSSLALSCDQPTEPDADSDNPGEERPPEERPFSIGGYHAYWMGDAWQTLDLTLLDRVYLFDLPVAPSGGLEDRRGWPAAWTGLVEASQAAGAEFHLTVSLLDAMTFESVFASHQRSSRLVEEIAELSVSGSVNGIQLDIELFSPVHPGLRDSLSLFVERLSGEMERRRPDAKLSLFMLARDDYDIYDEERLAAAVDDLVIQGYDLHWAGDEHAGPVAPVSGWGEKNWGALMHRLDVERVSRQKAWISVPYYGYQWPTADSSTGAPTRGPGHKTTYAKVLPEFDAASELAAVHGWQRDSTSWSPYYSFEDSTGWHQGWFEDAESLSRKYRFARQQGLSGVVIFPLGYDAGHLDEALRAFRAELPPTDMASATAPRLRSNGSSRTP